MDFSGLPKIELHLHLDCSLSYKVVKALKPQVSEEEYRKNYVAPSKCTNLLEYISCAASSIDIMQTEKELERVTLDLFEQLKADNVIYAEIRFAPLQHLQKGLSPNQVVEAVLRATEAGIKLTDVQAGIILCTLRNFSKEESLATVELVEEYKGTHVVGFDIAADEAGFPIDNHIKAFEYARDHGIPCTAHAGEACGPESVWETLNHFHPKRIGHGIRSIEDPVLIDFIKYKNIHLEVCPTSNICTNVFAKMEDHSINNLYEQGVSLSINTDGRALSDVTLEDEYAKLNHYFGWMHEHFYTCNREAIDAAFTSPEIKLLLHEKLKTGFGH